MDFLKKLFNDDDMVIGLSSIKTEINDFKFQDFNERNMKYFYTDFSKNILLSTQITAFT